MIVINSLQKISLGIVSIFLILILGLNNFGQEMSFGDESVKDSIKKKTSEIYENKDETHFLLTEKSFQTKSICGTEITAYSKSGEFNRLVVKTCNVNGKAATEYFFDNEKLIFAYLTFEFFEEKANDGMWKNFKNLAGWESRYYFVSEKLKFHVHKGRNDINDKETGESVKEEAYKLSEFVKKNTKFSKKN